MAAAEDAENEPVKGRIIKPDADASPMMVWGGSGGSGGRKEEDDEPAKEENDGPRRTPVVVDPTVATR